LVGVAALALGTGSLLSKNRHAKWAGSVLALLFLLPHIAIEARSDFEATRSALAFASKRAAHKDAPKREGSYPLLLVDSFSLESYARAAGNEPRAFERPI